MLGSFRKFSTSIYAKIVLGIIVIPFVFWGMGSTFTSGSKNIILKLDKDKHSVQDFIDFIQMYYRGNEKPSDGQIDELLLTFVGDKLIEKEIEYYNIKLSDESLASLIKSRKEFKRENKFSRVEYEKFLLQRNITAATFELNLSKQEKKKQFLDFVGGGLLPSKLLINLSYDKQNQKRTVKLIDLNDLFKEKVNFSEKEIISYFNENKEKFVEDFNTIKIVKLTPELLVNDIEFTDLFFKKIDEIDDLIIQGNNLNNISKKFNINNTNQYSINKFGNDINYNKVKEVPDKLINIIFSLSESEPVVLEEVDNNFFVIELIESKSINRDIKDENVKKSILLNLETKRIRKSISVIINQINQNKFKKSDFDEISKQKNAEIKTVKLKNQNDNDILKTELVSEIYKAPEKKVVLVNDISFKENYLVYVDSIENVNIDENPEKYKEHLILSKLKISNELFNTYDSYIKKKYDIEINHKALDTVKSYFN